MELREEEFYNQYHQHGGTTIIPTEIFNELYDDATEEIERLNKALDTATEIINNKHKEIVILNNIINELEVFLKEGTKLATGCGITKEYIYAYENALDKLQELKGSVKE